MINFILEENLLIIKLRKDRFNHLNSFIIDFSDFNRNVNFIFYKPYISLKCTIKIEFIVIVSHNKNKVMII